MPDQRVVDRIDAWAAAGLIDEATANRLRAVEVAQPAVIEPASNEPSAVDPAEPQ